MDAPSAMGPMAADAVDVVLIEAGDRVPLLLDMNVKGIRHRMARQRRGKQMFLPRRVYATDGVVRAGLSTAAAGAFFFASP